MLPSDWLSQLNEKQSNQLWSEEVREILIDQLIDQWGEESFPASDPPGRLPPSLGDALPHSETSQVRQMAESDAPVVGPMTNFGGCARPMTRRRLPVTNE